METADNQQVWDRHSDYVGPVTDSHLLSTNDTPRIGRRLIGKKRFRKLLRKEIVALRNEVWCASLVFALIGIAIGILTVIWAVYFKR